MLNKTRLLLTFTALLFSAQFFAQSYPKIDKSALYDIIEKDSTHKFFTVFIFTNLCIGNKFINDYKHLLDSITDGQTKFILAHSSSGNDRGTFFEKAIANLQLDKNEIYLIDESKYKFIKKDSQLQGMLFRNDICDECKFMEVGTVYKLVFDKEKNVLYHGYFLEAKRMSAILSCK